MTTLTVKGMHCHACETLIKDALEDIGATKGNADWKTGKVSFEGDEKKAREVIKEEGYEVV